MTIPADRITRALHALICSIALLLLMTACAPVMKSTAAKPPTPQQMHELWIDPGESQNRIYLVNGAASGPARRFVIQDLGASLGNTGWPTGNRNDVESFERQNLIDGVKNGFVDFDYHGRHQELFKDIAPADVVWVSRLLARLTDQQWNDAFRAAAYPEDVRRRYVSKLKSKIQEGLALETRAATTQ